jgi:hypothetical protein
MDKFEIEFQKEMKKYAQGLEYKTYIEELFDGQENYFGELRVDGTVDFDKGLEDVKIMLVNNGMNDEPIAVDITAMVSDDKFTELFEIANERCAEHLSNIFKDMYENME